MDRRYPAVTVSEPGRYLPEIQPSGILYYLTAAEISIRSSIVVSTYFIHNIAKISETLGTHLHCPLGT